MTENITSHGKDYKVLKLISFRNFNLTCKGCRSKFNNFVRFCLTPDRMTWTCQNCSSEFRMNCVDFETSDEITLSIEVTHIKKGLPFQDYNSKKYVLIDNHVFKEVQEVQNDN